VESHRVDRTRLKETLDQSMQRPVVATSEERATRDGDVPFVGLDVHLMGRFAGRRIALLFESLLHKNFTESGCKRRGALLGYLKAQGGRRLSGLILAQIVP